MRCSAKLMIGGEPYRIEFAEPDAPKSRVPGTIVGREVDGNGQFRLVPLSRED